MTSKKQDGILDFRREAKRGAQNEKKWIAIFMTICLFLTGCQGNVKETEQKENRQETAENTKAPECEYTWATSHCTYRIETSSQVHVPENSDEEYEVCTGMSCTE